MPQCLNGLRAEAVEGLRAWVRGWGRATAGAADGATARDVAEQRAYFIAYRTCGIPI